MLETLTEIEVVKLKQPTNMMVWKDKDVADYLSPLTFSVRGSILSHRDPMSSSQVAGKPKKSQEFFHAAMFNVCDTRYRGQACPDCDSLSYVILSPATPQVLRI